MMGPALSTMRRQLQAEQKVLDISGQRCVSPHKWDVTWGAPFVQLVRWVSRVTSQRGKFWSS